MYDFIHGRHGGRETKGSSSCLGPARTCWHMQTENSGIENLQNNNINHDNVCLAHCSGLYFRISVSLSLSILDSKTVYKCFIK
jgi:hypothetical protein